MHKPDSSEAEKKEQPRKGKKKKKTAEKAEEKVAEKVAEKEEEKVAEKEAEKAEEKAEEKEEEQQEEKTEKAEEQEEDEEGATAAAVAVEKGEKKLKKKEDKKKEDKIEELEEDASATVPATAEHQVLSVPLPAGRLRVTFHRGVTPPTVDEVKDGSPMMGLLYNGDVVHSFIPTSNGGATMHTVTMEGGHFVEVVLAKTRENNDRLLTVHRPIAPSVLEPSNEDVQTNTADRTQRELYVCARILVWVHACAHARTRTHAHTHARPSAHAQARMHAQLRAHKYARTLKYALMHKHARMQTRCVGCAA